MKAHYWLILLVFLPLSLHADPPKQVNFRMTRINFETDPISKVRCEYQDILKFVKTPDGTQKAQLELSPKTALQPENDELCRKVFTNLTRLDEQSVRDDVAAILKDYPCKPDSELSVEFGSARNPRAKKEYPGIEHAYIVNYITLYGCLDEMPPLCSLPSAHTSWGSLSIIVDYESMMRAFQHCLESLNEEAEKKALQAHVERLPNNEAEWLAYQKGVESFGLTYPQVVPEFIGPLMRLERTNPIDPALRFFYSRDLLEKDGYLKSMREEVEKYFVYSIRNEYQAGEPYLKLTDDRNFYYYMTHKGERIPKEPKRGFSLALPFHNGVAPVFDSKRSGRFGRETDPYIIAFYKQMGVAPKDIPEFVSVWSLIDRNGELVNDKVWSEVGPFNQGHARAKDGGGFYGIIDTAGDWVSHTKWKFATHPVDGITFAGNSRPEELIERGDPERRLEIDRCIQLFDVTGKQLAPDELEVVRQHVGALFFLKKESEDTGDYYRRVKFSNDPKREANALINTAYNNYSQLGGADFYWPERVEWLAAEAKRVDPNNAYVHKMHGWCLINLGFDERALEQFRKAIDLSDGEVGKDTRAALAICHWHLGDKDKAAQHYQKLVKLNPDYGKADWLTALGWTEREKKALIELQKGL